MKSLQRYGASRRSARHVDSTRCPKPAQSHERSSSRASRACEACKHQSTPLPAVSKSASWKKVGLVACHAKVERLLDQLDGDGTSKAAISPPLTAGGNCEPFFINDECKSVLNELQGMSEQNKAKLQAVHDETKTMQARITEYVEQRLREHDELWENRIAQEVRKQVDNLSVAVQKQEGPFAADALPSTLLASQGQSIETTPRMHSCSSLPGILAALPSTLFPFRGQSIETTPGMHSCSSLPGILAALPPTNTVASEQQKDHLEQDLVMQQAMQLVATEQQLEAIEKRLVAAAAKTEREARFTSLVSSSWSSVDTLQVSGLSTCSQFSPECRTSPEQWKQQLQQPQQKAFQSHLSVSGASSITSEPLPTPDWQQTRHRVDGNCSKRYPGQSLADILEYQRRICEGLPPPSEVVQ